MNMRRLIPILLLLSLLPLVRGADEAESVELREIRELLVQQAKKIETLAGQVAKLTQTIEAQKETAAAQAPAAAEPAPEAPVPRAEAVEPAPRHVVEKGETLTSIAKHYNITISELQNLNKITDGRKLQIGQSLIIPAPKAPEPPADKK